MHAVAAVKAHSSSDGPWRRFALRFPRQVSSFAPPTATMCGEFRPHPHVDPSTHRICASNLSEGWSPAFRPEAVALLLWSYLKEEEQTGGWASVAAPFQVELLHRVWGAAYRQLEPHTTHTTASLSVLSNRELRAMVEGHPSNCLSILAQGVDD